MPIVKVTIKDSQALSSITIPMLESYLTRSGWHKRDDYFKIMSTGAKFKFGEIWSWDANPRPQSSLLVPNSEKMADYVARMGEALYILEQREGRSQLEIFVDITGEEIVIKPTKIKKEKVVKKTNKK